MASVAEIPTDAGHADFRDCADFAAKRAKCARLRNSARRARSSSERSGGRIVGGHTAHSWPTRKDLRYASLAGGVMAVPPYRAAVVRPPRRPRAAMLDDWRSGATSGPGRVPMSLRRQQGWGVRPWAFLRFGMRGHRAKW